VAGEQPLVCVVDDGQWLGQASGQTPGFAARRPASGPVGLVSAAREPGTELAGLPELAVAKLGERHARALPDSALTGPPDARVRDQSESIPQAGIFCCQCLCVGFGVLHDDDNLPVRALRDRVPDGQTVRRKVKTIGTWQRIYLGKRVGKRRDWLFEQVEDRPMGGVPEWLRQSFKLVPDSVREAKDPVTY